MARPLGTSDSPRQATNGTFTARIATSAVQADARPDGKGQAAPAVNAEPKDADEVTRLRSENEQLRALCLELEQALHEATQQGDQSWEDRAREYEALLEEKSETIRQLHKQLQETKAMLEEVEAQAAQAMQQAQANPHRSYTGPAPREEELLSLSEELERERRQLQEDEQTLMEQMREMEVSMAKERAEMARQRNDLQRLQSEIRHELERLEKTGAAQRKMEELKSKLQDATTRRGAAPSVREHGTPSNAGAAPAAPSIPPTAPAKKDTLMGRWFGGPR
jgi:chromosome segregation ATPase